MKYLICTWALWCCLTLVILVGCGGGGGNSVSSGANGTGSALITTDWLTTGASANAKSISIMVRTGGVVLAEKMLNRPASGASGTTTFDGLPVGFVSCTASAYTLPDGKGTLLGSVTQRVDVRAGQQTRLEVKVNIQEKGTHIDGIEMCIPLSTTIGLHESIQLAATAMDIANIPVFAHFSWSSSNPAVATVDNTGKVTANRTGSSNITAREVQSGVQSSLLITVAEYASQLSIFPPDPRLTVGNRTTLSASAPNNAGEQVAVAVVWRSGNSGIASVDNDGIVTGIRSGNTRITATDRASGKSATVTVEVTEPAHAGGGRIVFYSDRTGNQEIYLMNADGSGLRQLTNHPAADTDPSFNRDGNKIAFVTERNGGQSIMTMGGTGGDAQSVVNNGASNIDPSFSVDGAKLVYASNISGNYEIYLLELANGRSRRLTDHSATDRHPSMSPDGQRIVFSSERSGNSDIFIMNVDGSGVTRLTTDEYLDGYPVFNPSGNKIAFMTNREGTHVPIKTFTMNLDGSSQHRVVDASHCTRMPSYSPDGRQFACAANPNRNFDIYIANIDGTGLTPVFVGPGKEMHPSWGHSSADAPIRVDARIGAS